MTGGRDGDIHGKCEKYDVKGDKWSEMPDLNVARCDHALTLFNNKFIFCFGGRSLRVPYLNQIEAFEILKNEWKVINYADYSAWPGARQCWPA